MKIDYTRVTVGFLDVGFTEAGTAVGLMEDGFTEAGTAVGLMDDGFTEAGIAVGLMDDGFTEAGIAVGLMDDGFTEAGIAVGLMDDGFTEAGTAEGLMDGNFDGMGAVVDLAATGCAVGGLGGNNCVIGEAHGCLAAPPPTPKAPEDAVTVLYLAASQFVIIDRSENSFRTSFTQMFSFPGAAKKAKPYAA